MNMKHDMEMKRERPNVGICDKQDIANQITNLINRINIMMHTNNVSTFDLKDIRDLVLNQSAAWEIDEFKNVLEQIWEVWPE